MASTIEDLYPHSKNNLSAITWAHRVNSQSELAKALSNSEIAMIEADVIIGKLNNMPNGTDMVIMGHPPNTTGDLSLLEFLEKVTADKKKGIKLDFKSIEAFEMGIPLIQKSITGVTPLWLNADILYGPVNSSNETVPVDPRRFLNGAARIPQALLSIGWTTRYESNNQNGKYTVENVNEMVKLLLEMKTNQSITYPVRACHAINSVQELQTLLTNTKSNKPTLTVWSSEGDKVDPLKLSELIRTVGVNKVYVDVPAMLWKQLNLSSSGFAVQNSMFVLLASTFASFCTAKLL